MMLMSKKNKYSKIVGLVLFVFKPLIVPSIIIVFLLAMVCSITDMLYIAFNNEDKVDINRELEYYQVKYEKNEMQGFFSRVWEFVQNIFGNGMLGRTEWPVKRTLHYNKWIWRKRSTNRRSFNNALWN